MRRIFELWIGDQSSGKTYQLRRRLGMLAARTRIRSVHVIAPPGEWVDLTGSSLRPGDRSWMAPPDLPLGEFKAVVGWDVPLERHDQLDRVLADVVLVGDCAVILDEAWAWAPPGSWTGSSVLRDIIVRGRHLERFDGRLRPTHMVMATQYPRTIHHVLREQAATIMVGSLAGELGGEWVRSVAGRDALRRVQRLGRWEWTAIRGRDPRRG